MTTKTLTGVPFFDKYYGGMYRGRVMLVNGRTESGKTALGIQFIRQGIKQNERCLILSNHSTDNILVFAEHLNLPLNAAVESGNMILLEYDDYVPGHATEQNFTLPPDGFLQFQEIVKANAIQRIVLDTVLPWISIHPQTNLTEHVFSFVRAFERIGATTIMTMPKPASLPSLRLKNAIENIAPISATLSTTQDSDKHLWITTKYLGEMKLDHNIPYQITPGVGIAISDDEQNKEPANAPAQKIKFSDAIK